MRRLEVWLDFGAPGPPPRHVGTLGEDGPRLFFEYSADFISTPLPLSPIALPVQAGLAHHHERDFDYLPGLLADALPDGFGRLLQDRAFEALGLARERVTPLDRLSALGGAALGALTFRPARSLVGDANHKDDRAPRPFDLDALAAQGSRLLEGSAERVLPELLAGGGSPGGARPKVLAGVAEDGRIIAGATTAMVTGQEMTLPHGYRAWIIKFPAHEDTVAFGPDAGAVEEVYAEMARRAGITVPRTRLFKTKGGRWFGIERFDRHGPGSAGRLHMHTAGGLLHASHRLPSLDYEALLRLTLELTHDHREVVEMYRRMVFNVLAHNRDDHARNFAFLMDSRGTWRLAPAFDLTFSSGISGHHTTSVSGETLAPTRGAMHALGERAGLSARTAGTEFARVASAVAEWAGLAKARRVKARVITRISARLDEVAMGARECRAPRTL